MQEDRPPHPSAQTLCRLVEHHPAWEVHALLRFHNVAYVAEYCPSPAAMGRTLPVVAHGASIYSGRQIFDDSAAFCASSCSEDEKSVNELIAAHVHANFDALFYTILRRRKEHIDTERERGSLIVGSLFSTSLGLMESIALFYKDDEFAGKDEVELLAKLDGLYAELDFSLGFAREEGAPLSTCWGSLRKCAIKTQHHRKADAAMFGHLARAYGHASTAAQLNKYSNISTYFRSLCGKYFGDMRHPAVANVWELSLQVAFNNPFFANSDGLVQEMLSRERDIIANADLQECREVVQEHMSREIVDEDSDWVSASEWAVLPASIFGRILSASFLAAVGGSFMGYAWFTSRIAQ